MRVDHAATAFTPLDFEYYPWSHSLGMSVIWSLVAFGLFKVLKRSTLDAGVIAAVVSSHWVLDVLTHRPDLPLWFGDSSKLGFGLWNSVAAIIIVELALFGGAVWLYVRETTASSNKGKWVFWSLIGFVTLIYFGNAFGPKPEMGTPAAAIAGPALAFWLLIAWAYWADRHRA